jgi:hypothetical protein
VNRTAFHEGIKAELGAYIAELGVPSNLDVREKFRTKMDFVADGRLN